MDFLKRLADSPADIFKARHDASTVATLNGITKSLLDPLALNYSVLDEIHTEGLDSTQVFGQAHMVLLGVGEQLLFTEIPQLKEKYEDAEKEAGSEEYFLTEEPEEQDEDSESEEVEAEDAVSEGAEEDAEEDAQSDALDDSEATKVADTEPVKDVFGLNDGFFDIDNFNKQIIALEDDEDDGEQIDLFGDLSDGEESGEEMDYYNEFFDAPGSKQATQAKEEEEEASELEDNEYDHAVDSAMLDLFADEADEPAPKEENLSSFEKQQRLLQAEIGRLEAELVAEKKWMMKGEVRSGDRPRDSLLDDDEAPTLAFDRTSKPVPVITDEVTETIEDLIRRRVRSDEFDDLPKRLITDVSKFVQKKKTEVLDQKSTKSLAEVYEDEYHGVDPEEKISDEVQAAHDELSDLFALLNHKLDSLCLAHYIPKPHEFKSIEIKVSDAPASISMEDAQPLHVSDETKLAPQEVYKVGDDKPKADGARGVLQVQLKSGLSYSKDELSREDKQRLRRAKKRSKSKHFNELKEIKEQREKQGAPSTGGDRKRQKVGEVIDTLLKAKNVTVIDKKGQFRDAQGNLKKAEGAQTSSKYRL